jgi:hypothetical protein
MGIRVDRDQPATMKMMKWDIVVRRCMMMKSSVQLDVLRPNIAIEEHVDANPDTFETYLISRAFR